MTNLKVVLSFCGFIELLEAIFIPYIGCIRVAQGTKCDYILTREEGVYFGKFDVLATVPGLHLTIRSEITIKGVCDNEAARMGKIF